MILRSDDPLAWQPVKPPTLSEFEVMAITAFRRLPQNFRDLCADLVIRVDGRSLTLEAPLRLGESDAISFVYSEVRASRYRRSFELSSEFDTGAIQADLRDGVLQLRLPKMERAKPRRIEVRAA